MGCDFAATHEFASLIFQEGILLSDGGWLDSFHVYVRTDSTWAPVSRLVVQPPYGGNDGQSYETYDLSFGPAVGDAVVIAGNPGGSANFISVSELRVLEISAANAAPTRYDVTFTARDAVGLTSSQTIPVWVNNSSPEVQVPSPADGTHCSRLRTTMLPCANDADGDRQVTLADLSILLTNFGTPSGMHLDDGDLDQDGDVDLADLSVLLTAFGASCP